MTEPTPKLVTKIWAGTTSTPTTLDATKMSISSEGHLTIRADEDGKIVAIYPHGHWRRAIRSDVLNVEQPPQTP